MESILYLLDSLVVLALVVASVLNDSRAPGRPLRGLFIYREDAAASPPPPPAAPDLAGWRGRVRRDA